MRTTSEKPTDEGVGRERPRRARSPEQIDRGQIVELPPLSSRSFDFRLFASHLRGIAKPDGWNSQPGCRCLQPADNTGSAKGAFAGCQSSQAGSLFNPSLIQFKWTGENGVADVAANWLEPSKPLPKANIPFTVREWAAETVSDELKLEFREPDTLLLRVGEPMSSDAHASIVLPLPNGLDLEISDRLCGEIRMQNERPNAQFHLHLITPGKIVYGHAEDHLFGNHWQKFAWAIGDMLPSNWSRTPGTPVVPASDLRFVRIVIRKARRGDIIELRQFGIFSDRVRWQGTASQ